MKTVHINCDLGEGGSRDADLMPLISACNIACGGHAGNLESMQETVALALQNSVEIGAHPSYPDKENFGRKSIKISSEELRRSLYAQMLSLKQIVEAEGGKLSHIKPHGALYNDAVKDEKIAEIFMSSVLELDQDLPIYAPENSVLARLAEEKIRVIFEAFADRAYEENYSLVSREKSGALITQKEEVFEHLFTMISGREITCKNGRKIGCKATTFCFHSDTPNSKEILVFLNQKLKEKGYVISNT